MLCRFWAWFILFTSIMLCTLLNLQARPLLLASFQRVPGSGTSEKGLFGFTPCGGEIPLPNRNQATLRCFSSVPSWRVVWGQELPKMKNSKLIGNQPNPQKSPRMLLSPPEGFFGRSQPGPITFMCYWNPVWLVGPGVIIKITNPNHVLLKSRTNLP